MAAIGWVERHWQGVVTDVGARKARCNLVLVAKATTILVGLEAARRRRREVVLTEGNN